MGEAAALAKWPLGIRAGARCDGPGPGREGFTRHGDEGGRVWQVWGWVCRHEGEQTEGKGKDDQENATVAEESEGEYDEEDDGDVEHDHDLDEDVEAGVRLDSPYSEPPPPPTIQIPPRSHPRDGGGQPDSEE